MKHFSQLSLAVVACVIALGLGPAGLNAQEFVATLRGDVLLEDQTSPPPMAAEVNKDLRQVRNYPEQPPLIPHKIDNYRIDKNSNKCLTCHSRTAVALSQAPMISVTHFMNRDGQVLASVSPRRFFCTQCHVSQLDVSPLIENVFVDVDTVIDYLQSQEGKSE